MSARQDLAGGDQSEERGADRKRHARYDVCAGTAYLSTLEQRHRFEAERGEGGEAAAEPDAEEGAAVGRQGTALDGSRRDNAQDERADNVDEESAERKGESERPLDGRPDQEPAYTAHCTAKRYEPDHAANLMRGPSLDSSYRC